MLTCPEPALLEWPPMQMIRLASVAYLNALPLTWGLTRGSQRGLYDLRLAAPPECARLLREGLVDAALIPSIEFARIPGLTPVPGTGISSLQEVKSVLLLSRRDPAAVGSLAADVNSCTSVALARLILRRRYGADPAVVPMEPHPDRMLRSHDAALLIGDAALAAGHRLEQAPDPSIRVLDLAREWNELTCLPFVFAFWACRPVLDAKKIGDSLKISLEEGLENVDSIAAAASERTGLPESSLGSYLRHNIHYRLGQRECDSLRVFYRLCRESGLLAGPVGDAAPLSSSATSNSG